MVASGGVPEPFDAAGTAGFRDSCGVYPLRHRTGHPGPGRGPGRVGRAQPGTARFADRQRRRAT
jgi:hypothetical protein